MTPVRHDRSSRPMTIIVRRMQVGPTTRRISRQLDASGNGNGNRIGRTGHHRTGARHTRGIVPSYAPTNTYPKRRTYATRSMRRTSCAHDTMPVARTA